MGQEIKKDFEYKQIDLNAKINQQGQPEFFFSLTVLAESKLKVSCHNLFTYAFSWLHLLLEVVTLVPEINIDVYINQCNFILNATQCEKRILKQNV